MPQETVFLELIQRVRSGDEAAATELVRRYEPAIRRAVRLHMRDPGLRRTLDSMDICQSVLASFFLRAAAGQYDLRAPDQLVRLLVVMARNKLASQARKAQLVRQSLSLESQDQREPIAPGPTPSQQLAGQELLQEVLKHLSADERQLVEQRNAGRQWTEIAEERGESAEALRKRLTRALDRVAQELGLDEQGAS